MTATATHDTKRGEDARARILALAEIPGEWASAVARWKLLNAPHLSTDGELRAPSATFEYMLYQALLGAGSRTTTSFADADAGLCAQGGARGQAGNELAQSRRGLRDGPARASSSGSSILRSPANSWTRCKRWRSALSLLGALNSLSQITLKATMPGVPDFYQGTEIWDFSLVDPDNRRPVDFAERAGRAGDAGEAGLGPAGRSSGRAGI